MSRDDEVHRHMALVRELSKPGRALSVNAPTATVKNSAWFVDGEPTLQRDDLHERLLAEALAKNPNAGRERRAVVMAGPPGAGKGTTLDNLYRDELGRFLVIDADDFKKELMNEAVADGSYESWIKPPEVRELESAGERFFPLEMAALVHRESANLAKELVRRALRLGMNIVIDGVLSDTAEALALGAQLDAAGYAIDVVDVEVSYEATASGIYERWERAYIDALDGREPLGGRWVPSEYARAVFDGPGGVSKPEAAARALAERCPAVIRYQLVRREPGRRRLEVDRSRDARGDDLVETNRARRQDSERRLDAEAVTLPPERARVVDS